MLARCIFPDELNERCDVLIHQRFEVLHFPAGILGWLVEFDASSSKENYIPQQPSSRGVWCAFLHLAAIRSCHVWDRNGHPSTILIVDTASAPPASYASHPGRWSAIAWGQSAQATLFEVRSRCVTPTSLPLHRTIFIRNLSQIPVKTSAHGVTNNPNSRQSGGPRSLEVAQTIPCLYALPNANQHQQDQRERHDCRPIPSNLVHDTGLREHCFPSCQRFHGVGTFL